MIPQPQLYEWKRLAEAATPRVDALIHEYMEKHPGITSHAQAAYYEDVHQVLAPLARDLEREVIQLRCELNLAKKDAERLDFIKKNGAPIKACNADFYAYRTALDEGKGFTEFLDFREAIDAAIAEQEREE